MPDTHDLSDLVRGAVGAMAEVVEEPAWVGTRWQVRGRTFAHVLGVTGAWPPAYARASGRDDAVLVMFRATGDELEALRRQGPPFFAPPWRRDEVGLIWSPPSDGAAVDATELHELLTESYCVMAPRRLADEVRRRG